MKSIQEVQNRIDSLKSEHTKIKGNNQHAREIRAFFGFAISQLEIVIDDTRGFNQ